MNTLPFLVSGGALDVSGGALDVLLQYGALGILVLILLGVVRVLYQDKAKQHEYERARADRLESLVHAQSQAMIDKIIPILSAATQTLAEVVDQRERGDDMVNMTKRRRPSL